jgi:hypothetical protein
MEGMYIKAKEFCQVQFCTYVYTTKKKKRKNDRVGSLDDVLDMETVSPVPYTRAIHISIDNI